MTHALDHETLVDVELLVQQIPVVSQVVRRSLGILVERRDTELDVVPGRPMQ